MILRTMGRLSSAVLLVMTLAVGAAAVTGVARATSITEFPVTVHAGSDPLGITAGPDGNLWFSDAGTTIAIGRITPAGVITEFTQGFTSAGKPSDITLGPDGNMWFTATGSASNAIGRVTPAGVITEFGTAAGLNPGSAPSNITAGPDGNLWFLDNGTTKAIGRITPAGTITEFNLDPLSQPEDLTPGPDGHLWFTDRGNTRAIGRATPGGTIIEFTSPLDQMNSMPNGITAGPDGNLWFTDEGSPGALGRATPGGTIMQFTAGLQSGSRPDAITAGSDGNAWFEDNLSGHRAVGRITPAGTISEFGSGLGTGLEDDITLGADGNVWVEQSSPGGIARITPAGVITAFTNGLLPGAGSDGDQLVTGPDGNLWFNDRGAKAIGKVSLQLPPTATTEPARAVTSSTATVSGSVNPLGSATTVRFQYGPTKALGSTVAAGTLKAGGDASTITARLSGLPPGTVVYYKVVAANAFGTTGGGVQAFTTSGTAVQATTATFGNQRITLTTPSLRSCTARAKTLSARLTSTGIPMSRGAKLRFVSAAFSLDMGVKHTHKPIAIARRLPAKLALRLAGLRSGSHTLTVTVSYKATVITRGHRRTVTRTKTLSVKFRVC